ncbi:MAG: ProQ/FinO family protein [Halothiobacillaceae bacterium]
MENQHPLDAAPELAEAVTAKTVAQPIPATSSASEQSKARHPRTLVARLVEAYPNAFSHDGRKVRPLAVGILKELQAAREGEGGHGLSTQELRRALRYYTQGVAYHRAVARGEARVNLAGEPVGEVSEDQKAYAEAKLAELAPKLPKRPERPARKAAEGEGGETQAERPRRLRKPSGVRVEARAKGKGEEGRRPRRAAGIPRPPRTNRPAGKEQPAAPALSAEEKLNLLLEKFGGP